MPTLGIREELTSRDGLLESLSVSEDPSFITMERCSRTSWLDSFKIFFPLLLKLMKKLLKRPEQDQQCRMNGFFFLKDRIEFISQYSSTMRNLLIYSPN